MASSALAHTKPGRPLSTRAQRRRRALVAYLFLLPALALIGLFTLVPFVQGIVLSFQTWDGIGTDTPFVGLGNYRRVMQDPIFWASMGNAFIFGAVALFIGNAISLGMAL